MEIALLGVALCAILFNRITFPDRLSSFTLIIVPYTVIILLNNFVAVRLGFYRVTDNTMFMVLVGTLAFFIGSVLARQWFQGENPVPYIRTGTRPAASRVCAGTGARAGEDEDIPGALSLPLVKVYVAAVLGLRVLQILLIYRRSGLARMIEDDFALMVTRGPMGHLMISLFPLIPVLFYDWLRHKKNLDSLFLSALYFALAFVETEKAQVLTVTIAVFLFCTFRDRRCLVRGALIMFALIVTFFVGNYVAKLTLQGYASAIRKEYYFYRLWNYIAGGIINSRVVTDTIAPIPTNGFHYLEAALLALPNLFIKGIFGQKLGPDMKAGIPYISGFIRVTEYPVGFRNQRGNVISTMTYLFGNRSWISFIAVMIIWGILSEAILCRMYRTRTDMAVAACCCFMSFSVVSFFGSYYTNSSFCERLAYCALWAVVFAKDGFFSSPVFSSGWRERACRQ